MLALVLARARRRRSAAALVALSIAGSIVVLGSLLGVGIVTEDLATRRAMADLPPPDRLIGIVRSAQSGFEDRDADQVARAALAPILDLTEPLLSVTLYQPEREPFRVLAMEGADQWVELISGRLPKPCLGGDRSGARCEAIRIGSDALPSGVGEIGTSVDMAGLNFDVVGVAAPSPDLPLDVIRPDGLALLVEGQRQIVETVDVLSEHRTQFWLAPIDPDEVRSWTLADFEARVDEVERVLGPAGRSFRLATPANTLAAVHQRTQVAVGRLVFISSLIVGVLLAFAVFAAAIERADVAREDRRLRAAGASRAARLLFVLGEAVLPALAGALVGLAGAAAAIAILAGSQGAPVDVVLGLALLQPASIALTAFLVGLAILAVALGIHPTAGRLLQPRIVVAAVVPAAAILLWNTVTRGPVDAATLANDATSPASVLLPGALGLAVILGSLVLLPPLLRGLARVTRRAPVGVRLAAISLAREPLRPAAIMTLLAFSVGAVVFGQVYSATLRQGAADQASFLVGMDIRLQTLAAEGRFTSEVIPRLRAGELGSDLVLQPMIRREGETASRRTFVLAGIEGSAIPELRGWRSDFSSQDPAALGAAIDLDGEWVLPGQPLPDGVRDVTIDVDYEGEPIQVEAVVEQADGQVRYIHLGELVDGRQTLTGHLFDEGELEGLDPAEPSGWRVLGLLFANGGPAGGGGPEQGHRQEGDITVRGLDEIIDPATSNHIVVSGEGGQLLRAPARTDGLILPALVSPELATDVDGEGVLDVRIGSSLDLRLHPVGVISQFPTIVDPGRVVIVDLAPLLLAMNAHDPGTGAPNQVLIGTPGDARTAEVAAALGQEPFPPLVIRSRPAVEEERANDPFSIGIVWALAVGAIAGLVLSFLGVLLASAAELRDERGELWELEAQGSTPRALTTLVVLRTVAMCAVGAVTGVVIGIALGWFVAQAIGVGGEAVIAVPPLVLRAPLGVIALVVVSLLLVIGVAVYTLTRRHFARASLGTGVR